MRRGAAKVTALGGVLAALAVVIMSLGTLIPLATYVCPMLCALILAFYHAACGARAAWAWYTAVSALSLLFAPDKEAAAVFLFLGYYPIIKPRLDSMKLSFLWKALLFNAMTLAMYGLLIYVFGMEQIMEEFQGLGIAVTVITLLLGNLTFFLLDRLLSMSPKKR